MLRVLLQPLRFLAGAFTEANSPHELAIGLALGVLLGLVPKGNLIALLMGGSLVVMRLNLGAATAGAFVFSWLGMLTDPLTHRVGLALLTWERLRPFWNALFGLPLVPWTHLNNTVVLGSLLLGLVLAYPVYFFSQWGFEHYRPLLAERLNRWRATRVLAKADQVSSWSFR